MFESIRGAHIVEAARSRRSPQGRVRPWWWWLKSHRSSGLGTLMIVQAIWFASTFAVNRENLWMPIWLSMTAQAGFGLFAIALPAIILVVVTFRAFRVQRLGRHVCIECGYDLRGVHPRAVEDDPDADGVCPECGRAFEIASMRRYWYPEAWWSLSIRSLIRRRHRPR